MTEDQLEQEALAWLQDVGYSHRYGPDIAHDSPTPERHLMPSSASHFFGRGQGATLMPRLERAYLENFS